MGCKTLLSVVQEHSDNVLSVQLESACPGGRALDVNDEQVRRYASKRRQVLRPRTQKEYV